MLIDWPKLLAALVLLLVPVALFHGKRVVYRDVSRDWVGFWPRTFGLDLHYADLFRAVLGAWLISEALTRAPEVAGAMKYSSYAAQTAVFALALTLQTMICKEEDSAHAPFAFVSGLALGFVPPFIAGPALLLAILITFGTKVASIYFPVLAAAVSALGFPFTGKKHIFALLIVTITAGLPWLLTLLFPRHFVASLRAKPKIGEPEPPQR